VLLNGCSDIRHALRTLQQNIGSWGETKEVNFYIWEKDSANIARNILMTEIVNNSELSFRERVELFFDVYWNTYIREKTAEYMDERIGELDRLVTDPDNCKLGIKELWSFKDMKFKDRDELVDNFKSWKSSVDFNLDVGST
jgi:hypothetical protein